MNGYIKLHRQLLEWEWYNNINIKTLFIHCLLRANHADKKWQGILIKKGSFITSYENLSIETGLSIHKIRTALDKLKMTGEVASKTTNQYSIITINNWDRFQIDDKQNDKQTANEWQTNGKRMATNKNDKNDKNIEEEKNYVRYGKEYQNVYLKKNHYTRLLNASMSIPLLNEIIEDYSYNIERGKEKRFDLQYPDAHYLGLMAYLKQRKKNPKIVPIEEKSHYRPA